MSEHYVLPLGELASMFCTNAYLLANLGLVAVCPKVTVSVPNGIREKEDILCTKSFSTWSN